MTTACPFAAAVAQDVVSLRLTTGERHEGAYLTQAGMHFLHVRDPASLHGTVIGPFDVEDVEDLAIVRRWADIKAERWEQSRGEPFPGPTPVTAADYEYRLQRLARAIAQEPAVCRRDQLRRQFGDCADLICLAQAKRSWVLAEGRWSLRNNAPPTLADLWMDDMASPSFFRRPRPTDFDPDPAVRRRRPALPDHIAADPNSIPAVLGRLRRAGLRARIVRAGDPVWERALIQIDLSAGRTGRFIARGERDGDRTTWSLGWGGNYSAAGLRHRSRAERLSTYPLMRAAVPVSRGV